ncbi:MAG: hypothetical protein G8237_15275 [Magnetococcales bacterium]|nr:hypothetical protein [Magnetococcales bacterium]NGZ07701.1 hypothetical protein [Magnetococcales bacterium]
MMTWFILIEDGFGPVLFARRCAYVNLSDRGWQPGEQGLTAMIRIRYFHFFKYEDGNGDPGTTVKIIGR